MKYLPRERAFGKLRALADGAAIVRRELSGLSAAVIGWPGARPARIDVRQRFRDAAVAAVIVVQPVGGDELRERLALATPASHQRAAGEQRGTGLGRHLRKRLVEHRLLGLRQQRRRLLVVHQDHVGSRGLQPAHTRGDHGAERRRVGVAQRAVGADLPDHKLRPHRQHIGVQPGQFLRGILSADAAIDHRDMGRPAARPTAPAAAPPDRSGRDRMPSRPGSRRTQAPRSRLDAVVARRCAGAAARQRALPGVLGQAGVASAGAAGNRQQQRQCAQRRPQAGRNGIHDRFQL